MCNYYIEQGNLHAAPCACHEVADFITRTCAIIKKMLYPFLTDTTFSLNILFVLIYADVQVDVILSFKAQRHLEAVYIGLELKLLAVHRKRRCDINQYSQG